MKLLDLFCGAGGAAMGYHRAGFEVTGVDNKVQPRYPFKFILADALTFPLDGYDVIHASPPCPLYSDLYYRNQETHPDYPNFISLMRERLKDRPYIIENVEGAPLFDAVTLCGVSFDGLRVIRHRLFESNLDLKAPEHQDHPLCFTYDKRKKHYGELDQWKSYVMVNGGGNCSLSCARDAMGISWMNKKELNQAVPPAYTEYLGKQII